MQISLSAGKGWFLFFEFHLHAILILLSFKKILQNIVNTVQLIF